MAHALIHAADQNHQRRVRTEREIAENRKPKRKRDRHAGKHGGRDNADEEDQKIEIAEPRNTGPASQNSATMTATAPSERSNVGSEPVRASRSTAKTIISAMPAGMAAARHVSVISSADVVIGS